MWSVFGVAGKNMVSKQKEQVQEDDESRAGAGRHEQQRHAGRPRRTPRRGRQPIVH